MLLSKLPDNLSNLKNLKYLNLSVNSFWSYPECVDNLEKLEYLSLYNCTSLKDFPFSINFRGIKSHKSEVISSVPELSFEVLDQKWK